MNKDKLWPIGLSIFLTLLIAGSVGMVIFTRQINNDLVTEDYYQQGQAYQQQIDRINNTKNLSRPLLIQVMEGNQVLLFFPADFNPAELSGTIDFFRPDDQKIDFSLPVQPDKNLRQVVDGSSLKKGNWKIKVLWNHQDLGFYSEKSINIE